MTKVCVYRKNKDIVKFTLDGHTGFAEQGEDIVCAAISTLATATLNGLTDVVKIGVGFEIRDAYIECILPDDISSAKRKSTNVLLETFYLSLKDLENQYEKYITITELEV